MTASVTETLNELLSRPSTAERCALLEQSAPLGDQEEKDLFARYEETVKQVRTRCGETEYEGIGPRWGYTGPGPGGNLNYYDSAVQIAWWRIGNDVAVVMATGHDADSLYCLWLAVVDRPDLA